MENIYISDINGTKEEFNEINDLFKSQGIKNLHHFNFGDYIIKKKSIFGVSEEICIVLQESINFDEEVNLICHSDGCNYGILATMIYMRVPEAVFLKPPILKNLILISPQLVTINKKEQRSIDIANKNNNYYGEKQNKEFLPIKFLSFKNQKLLKQLEYTRDLAYKAMDSRPSPWHSAPRTLVVHSIGDRYVSKEGLDRILKDGWGAEEFIIESTMNNPLLSEKGPLLAKKISSYII